MRKIIYFKILTFLFIASSIQWSQASLRSSQTSFLTDEESLKSYFPSFVHSKIGAVQEAIESETKEDVPTNEGENWGVNYPHLDQARAICLQLIQGRYAKSGERIPVIDLGCGSGLMSWKMMVAGGDLYAVEQSRKAAVEANKRIFSYKKFLKEGELAKNCYKVFVDSIIDPKTKWTERNHQIGYCGNVLHFFNREECVQFASLMYGNLLNRGILIISVNAPHFHPSYLKYYKKNLKEGKVCPGYGVYTKKYNTSSVEFVGTPALLPPEEMKAGRMYDGIFSSEDGVTHEGKNYKHTIRNYFKVPELASLFEEVGFKTAKGFYINQFGAILEDEPTTAGVYNACVILTKGD